MTNDMNIEANDCLIIVDVQNDFCPGGALEVPRGDEVVPIVNSLQGIFSHQVMTQDWHPADHFSFASNHPGKSPFETTLLSYGEQVLWPDHCVQDSHGADFHVDLETTRAQMSIRKGFRKEIDSYSAFYENDRKTPTGLTGYLNTRGFQRVFFAGLATDFCVGYSAIDAAREGFQSYVVEDACRAIDLDGSLDRSKQDMHDAGVQFVDSTALKIR